MNETIFNKLTNSVRQMNAIRAGKLQPARTGKLTPDHPAAVRSRLGMTQSAFAVMIGVPLGTLRNWEQGHRQPTGPAKALLCFAAKYPKQAAAALAPANRGSSVIVKRETGRSVSIQPRVGRIGIRTSNERTVKHAALAHT
ncbi:MAG TPA: helix-turn-helix domain-containing protein [Opitutaceae bacterium]|nr:helix-turn-helix domain-containing protein [Opitutaceae bacterium]